MLVNKGRSGVTFLGTSLYTEHAQYSRPRPNIRHHFPADLLVILQYGISVKISTTVT